MNRREAITTAVATVAGAALGVPEVRPHSRSPGTILILSPRHSALYCKTDKNWELIGEVKLTYTRQDQLMFVGLSEKQ